MVVNLYEGGPGHTVSTPYSPIYVTPKVSSPPGVGRTTYVAYSNETEITGGSCKHTLTIYTIPSTVRSVTVGTFLPLGPPLKDETSIVRP